MAGGGVGGSPYPAALQLAAWALSLAPYLRGRLLLAGVDYGSFSAGDWMDVTFTMLVDMPDGMVDRFELMDVLDARLRVPLGREGHGYGPEAEAGARAMEELAGGPAPLRPPGAKRPEPAPEH